MQDSSTGTGVFFTPNLRKVLVKFFFTNPKHIPFGIPEQSRETDQKMDLFHASVAAALGKVELGEVGRVREGRVDTGRPAVQNAQLVQAALLRRGLTNVSFGLYACHWFFQERKGKYAVVLAFGWARDIIQCPPEVTEALRELGRTTWQWCWVYDNKGTFDSVTINFGGRCVRETNGKSVYQTPKLALRIQNHELHLEPVEQEIKEEVE